MIGAHCVPRYSPEERSDKRLHTICIRPDQTVGNLTVGGQRQPLGNGTYEVVVDGYVHEWKTSASTALAPATALPLLLPLLAATLRH